MAIVMTAFAAAAFVLLLQAMHVLKTGSLLWFFISAPPPPISDARTTSNRVLGVVVYGLPGCALLSLLVYKAVTQGKSAILAAPAADLGNLVGGLILFTLSFSIVLWPRWMLKSVQASYPNVDLKIETGLMRAFMRVVAAGVMGLGLLLLSFVK